MRFFLPLFFSFITILLSNCTKSSDIITENTSEQIINGTIPINPYATIDSSTIIPPDEYAKNSLVYIHSTIFAPKCGIPGCHDGHFEPDFRTPESTFNTTLFHPITKNNAAESFTYRIVPEDTNSSVLYERITNCCFANTNDRMPQDNIGQALPQEDIDNIANWILSGAPNTIGSIASIPNRPPSIEPFYFALNGTTFNTTYSGEDNREDGLIYNPFHVPNNTNMVLVFSVNDDSTAIADMQVNTLQLSSNIEDFSNAIEYTGTFFTNPDNGDQLYLVNIQTQDLPLQTILYMRYIINDGDQSLNTYFPTNRVPIQYQTYWSFIVS